MNYSENCKNELKQREMIEWTNFWWDRADEDRPDRILLVGDSTSRAYRRSLSEITGRPTDYFGTSSIPTDLLFWKQIECFVGGEYRYSTAVIQLGYHHIQGGEYCKCNTDTPEEYKRAYAALVEYLRTEFRCDVVIMEATHVVKLDSVYNGFLYSGRNPVVKLWNKIQYRFFKRKLKDAEVDDAHVNQEILARNAIAEEVAKEKDLPFIPMYSKMLESGYLHKDIVHFEDQANLRIAQIVKECI